MKRVVPRCAPSLSRFPPLFSPPLFLSSGQFLFVLFCLRLFLLVLLFGLLLLLFLLLQLSFQFLLLLVLFAFGLLLLLLYEVVVKHLVVGSVA